MDSTVKSLAMEMIEQKNPSNEDSWRIARDLAYTTAGTSSNPGSLWSPSNMADNSRIHIPLLRQERMGCSWFAAIFELEGVIVEDNPELEKAGMADVVRRGGEVTSPCICSEEK